MCVSVCVWVGVDNCIHILLLVYEFVNILKMHDINEILYFFSIIPTRPPLMCKIKVMEGGAWLYLSRTLDAHVGVEI